MGVSADIIEHLLGSGEGPLGVDDPFCLFQRLQVSAKRVPIPEAFQFGEEFQFARVESISKMLQKETPE